MNVIDAKIENADDIYKLNNKYFTSEKLSLNSINDYINNITGLDKVKIFIEDKKLIGYIIYRLNDDISELLDIAIDENYRLKGYGEELIVEMVKDVKSIRSKKIMLEVRADNKSAINLYKKLGFKNISIRKNYYKNPMMDAYVMEKEC